MIPDNNATNVVGLRFETLIPNIGFRSAAVITFLS
jgi:hypothetical protein